MNPVICIVIVLVCWNVLLTIFLAEHIMETREHLHKLFEFFIDVLDILREIINER